MITRGDSLFPIAQPAPVRCQEVRHHQRLAIAFGLRFRLSGQVAPSCVAFVVLEKSGLVVGDQNEAKASHRSRDWEPIGAWEFCSIVIPSMEASLISHPVFHETLPIFHHVRPLMPVKIHPIFQGSIGPAQFLEPTKCGCDRN
jgi:hypothetical protein